MIKSNTNNIHITEDYTSGYSHASDSGAVPSKTERDPLNDPLLTNTEDEGVILEKNKIINKIGVYTGRFQPTHRGHIGVYKKLKQITGNNTFIVTSDKVNPPESPLNFNEKEQILVRHGIPDDHIIKSQNVHNPIELFKNFSSNSTAAIFALGERDAERFVNNKIKDKNEKEIWLKQDSSPSYFQPYKGNELNLEPFKNHSYVLIIQDIKIDGKIISSTNIRNILSSNKYSKKEKINFFKWVMGWFDSSIFDLLKEKLNNSMKDLNEKEELKNYIKKIVREIIDINEDIPQGAMPQSVSDIEKGLTTTTASDSYEKRKQLTKTRQDAMQAKQRLEREQSARKKELQYKKRDIEKIRKDDLPKFDKEKDELNKIIGSTSQMGKTFGT